MREGAIVSRGNILINPANGIYMLRWLYKLHCLNKTDSVLYDKDKETIINKSNATMQHRSRDTRQEIYHSTLVTPFRYSNSIPLS